MATARNSRKTERSPLVHVPGAAGADEAGRGPLAGPVVAAAVILPDGFDLIGIVDSKVLDREARLEAEARIKAGAVWAVAACEAEEIDRLNILWASLMAMERSLDALGETPSRVLIDGNRAPRGGIWEYEPVVKGDGTYACIAAASILAKTERDRRMCAWATEFPQYGFDRHFGYPTPDHLEALRQHGPCALHRRSFGPVRDAEQLCLMLDA